MSLVILKSEYLKLIQTHSKLIAELPKAVQFCAAKLIQYFQHWSEWKRMVHRTMWIYMPFKKIHEDLMGEHSLHVIRAAIALLEKLGLIEKRHNPNGQDKTWQYKLNKDILSSLLNIDVCNAKPTSANADYERLCDGVSATELSPEHGTFKAEHGENNVEQHTQDQSIDIKATTNALVEEKACNESLVTEDKQLTSWVNCSANFSNCSSTSEVFWKESLSPKTSIPTNITPPTPFELDEVNKQLRELRVNPDSCRGVIVQYWANVHGAIAYLKTATWATKPIAVFISACKKGLTPDLLEESRRSSIPIEVGPSTEEQTEALDMAKSRKEIKDYFFSGDGITKVVLFNGIQLPWWDFLEVSQC